MVGNNKGDEMTIDDNTKKKIFRAFAYGSICAEVADHFGISLAQARALLREYKDTP